MDTTRKEWVYEILEIRMPEIRLGRYIAGTLSLLILINVIAAVLETDVGILSAYGGLLDVLAAFSVMVFTLEYILRVWCCTANPEYRNPVWGRLKYMRTPIAIIDLLVIMPFLLTPVLTAYPGVISIIRFSRIFWILKIGHYSNSFKTFWRVLSAKRGEMFIAFFVMFVLLILGSALIFFAEHDAQPQKFSSVLASMWGGIETMATIGYGDMVPVTSLGKLIAGIVALLGVGLFALPAGFLASGFIEEVHRKEEERSSQKESKPPGTSLCPHCGKDVLEPPGKKE